MTEFKPFLRIFLKPDGKRWYDFPLMSVDNPPLQTLVNTIHMEGYAVSAYAFVRWEEIQSGAIVSLPLDSKPNLVSFPGGGAA